MGLTLWDEGKPTKAKRTLGLRFADSRSPKRVVPTQTCVLRIAKRWSLNPLSLGEAFKEPVAGLQGRAAWATDRTNQ